MSTRKVWKISEKSSRLASSIFWTLISSQSSISRNDCAEHGGIQYVSRSAVSTFRGFLASLLEAIIYHAVHNTPPTGRKPCSSSTGTRQGTRQLYHHIDTCHELQAYTVQKGATNECQRARTKAANSNNRTARMPSTRQTCAPQSTEAKLRTNSSSRRYRTALHPIHAQPIEGVGSRRWVCSCYITIITTKHEHAAICPPTLLPTQLHITQSRSKTTGQSPRVGKRSPSPCSTVQIEYGRCLSATDGGRGVQVCAGFGLPYSSYMHCSARQCCTTRTWHVHNFLGVDELFPLFKGHVRRSLVGRGNHRLRFHNLVFKDKRCLDIRFAHCIELNDHGSTILLFGLWGGTALSIVRRAAARGSAYM